jgi:hypothetical protein
MFMDGVTRNAIVLAVSTMSCLTAGCAGRAAPKAPGPPGTAKVGWVIMSGDRENPDREFICQSEPRTDCVMAASRGTEQVFAHVYVYHHAAATQLKYTGSIRVPFFNGGAYDFQPDLMVAPGGSPGNQSIVGVVTATPGTYPFTIAVVATPPTGVAKDIRDEIPVRVN